MSPKPIKRLISLAHCGLGLAGHYRWEKEVLIDYIATRFGFLSQDIEEDAKFDGICDESHYLEMVSIAKALRKYPGTGMGTKIELTGTFYDLRDFVEWSKEELGDYLIHQIVRCDLSTVFGSDQVNEKAGNEIVDLAYAIYAEENIDGCTDAEKAARFWRSTRDAKRNSEKFAPDSAPSASSGGIAHARPRSRIMENASAITTSVAFAITIGGRCRRAPSKRTKTGRQTTRVVVVSTFREFSPCISLHRNCRAFQSARPRSFQP
jgi:hypothetical protein